jgi:hypothetical protein
MRSSRGGTRRQNSLSGRVTSSSGSPVANARLVLKTITSSDIRSETVNSDGSYLVANLLPGTYEITVAAHGFADAHTRVASDKGKKTKWGRSSAHPRPALPNTRLFLYLNPPGGYL